MYVSELVVVDIQTWIAKGGYTLLTSWLLAKPHCKSYYKIYQCELLCSTALTHTCAYIHTCSTKQQWIAANCRINYNNSNNSNLHIHTWHERRRLEQTMSFCIYIYNTYIQTYMGTAAIRLVWMAQCKISKWLWSMPKKLNKYIVAERHTSGSANGDCTCNGCSCNYCLHMCTLT